MDCSHVDNLVILELSSHKTVVPFGWKKPPEVLAHLPFVKKPIKEFTLKNLLMNFVTNKTLRALTKSSPENSPNKLPRDYKANILVAEDNVINQKIVSKLLNKFGYSSVTIVENGKLAVEACKKSKYDIVLMDCMVCQMSFNFSLKSQTLFLDARNEWYRSNTTYIIRITV